MCASYLFSGIEHKSHVHVCRSISFQQATVLLKGAAVQQECCLISPTGFGVTVHKRVPPESDVLLEHCLLDMYNGSDGVYRCVFGAALSLNAQRFWVESLLQSAAPCIRFVAGKHRASGTCKKEGDQITLLSAVLSCDATMS